MAKPKVYSYSRFSDPRQATGHSAERQAEYAARWAEEHGLTLDKSLSLKDEGLSAYHQDHIKRGALGTFLRAVEDSMIPQGSVLIVEGLDRLSRAEPIQAQAQLASIIGAGITVVTASDGKEYNREKLKAQPMDLVYSLLVMVRANEESETKSKRVTAAIRRQCEAWQAGTYRGLIRNGKDPAWLHWTGDAWEMIPERAAAIRAAVKLYREGNGGVRIVRELSARGISITDIGCHVQQIYRIVKLRALIGEKTLEVAGQEYRLKGYYPPLMTDDEFADLQTYVNRRFVRKGKGEIPSIVTGIGMTRCGYCGCTVNATNAGEGRRNSKGHMLQGHRRVMCSGYRQNEGCVGGYSTSVVPVENAIMDFCSDQMNLTALITGGDRSAPIVARINMLRRRMADTEKSIDKLTAIMLSDDGDMPQAFIKKARDLEQQQAKDRADLEAAEFELSAIGTVKTPVLAKSWIEARDAAKALDYDARMKVRQLVLDTFSRIVIYLRGIEMAGDESDDLDMVLVSKNGNTRTIRVNRFTGEWRSMEDYSASAAA